MKLRRSIHKQIGW